MEILLGEDREYSKLYPEVNERFCFTVSTLAKGVSKQIYSKDHPESRNYNRKTLIMPFVKGKAFHEFLQNHLNIPREYPLKYDNGKFKIIGHADNIDFENRMILEYKTTSFNPLPEYLRKEFYLQVGSYCKLLEFSTGLKFNGQIFVFNGQVIDYLLTEEENENAWIEILKRAEDCYKLLGGI